MFQLPGHLLQKLLYNLVSSLASLEQFSQHLSEMLCPELKSSESLLNKIQPNVVDCLFFQLTGAQQASQQPGQRAPHSHCWGFPQDCAHTACTLGVAPPHWPPLAPPSRGWALLSHPSSMQSTTLQFCFVLNRVTQAQPLHTALAQPGTPGGRSSGISALLHPLPGQEATHAHSGGRAHLGPGEASADLVGCRMQGFLGNEHWGHPGLPEASSVSRRALLSPAVLPQTTEDLGAVPSGCQTGTTA